MCCATVALELDLQRQAELSVGVRAIGPCRCVAGYADGPQPRCRQPQRRQPRIHPASARDWRKRARAERRRSAQCARRCDSCAQLLKLRLRVRSCQHSAAGVDACAPCRNSVRCAGRFCCGVERRFHGAHSVAAGRDPPLLAVAAGFSEAWRARARLLLFRAARHAATAEPRSSRHHGGGRGLAVCPEPGASDQSAGRTNALAGAAA